MNTLKSFTGGFRKAANVKKTIAVIYLITLLLGLAVAIPFESQISKAAGSRMQMYRLLKEFDFTAYGDFMNFHSELINPFLSMITWFAVFYIFFTIFFTGGIIRQFINTDKHPGQGNFFSGSAEFFLRFLRLAFYILLLQFAMFLPAAIIFSSIFNAMQKTAAEPALFTLLVVWLSVHILAFLLLTIVSDFAKVRIAQKDSKKVWMEIRGAFSFVIKRMHKLLPLYFMIISVFIAGSAVYLASDSLVGAYNNPTILLMLIIQQIYIFFRLFVKIWVLGSVFMYEQEAVEQIPAEAEEEYVN